MPLPPAPAPQTPARDAPAPDAPAADAPAPGSVVLLHGLGRTGISMRLIAAALETAAYPTLSPWYGSRKSMTEIIDYLHPRIAAHAAAHPGPVHIVTHSLGGLVARALIATHRPAGLGRVVMLAPPHGGSNLADTLHDLGLDRLLLGPVAPYLRTTRSPRAEERLGKVDFDLGIIAGNRTLDPILPRLLLPGPNDGKVAVGATRISGMTDHIVLPVQHTMMVADRRVIDQTLAYIATGAFKR